MSQAEKIMAYLKTHSVITQREAYRMGIYRLGARIYDLRNNGVPIKGEFIKVKNADGSHTYIAQYTLPKEEKQ